MDALLIALGILVVAAAAAVAYAATKPDVFRVARTLSVTGPPERVFAQINNLKAMNAWNPFDRKQDPDIKGSYNGPESGVGAHYDFESKKAGTGFIEIIESEAPIHVRMRLFMTKPMACDNQIDFNIVPRDGACDVTWAMSGNTPLIGKVFGLFCNMDKMCGGMFEKGLADLKATVERRQAG